MSQRFDVARVVANRSLAFHRVLARATKGTARLIENATLTATFFLALFLCAFSSVRANFPGDGNLSRRSLWFSDNAAVDDPWASDFQGTTRGQSDDFLEPSLGSSSSDWPEDPEEPEEVDPSERFDTMRVGESTLYAPRRDVSSSNIVISAQYGWKGDSDEYGDVYVLYGDCQISQDEGSARAPIAVVWISNESGEEGSGAVGARVRAYLERDNSDGLRLDLNQVCLSAKTNGKAWLGEFSSLGETDLRIALPGETQIQPNEVYFRALNFLEEETSDSQSDDATGAGGSIESVLPSAPTDAPLLEKREKKRLVRVISRVPSLNLPPVGANTETAILRVLSRRPSAPARRTTAPFFPFRPKDSVIVLFLVTKPPFPSDRARARATGKTCGSSPMDLP